MVLDYVFRVGGHKTLWLRRPMPAFLAGFCTNLIRNREKVGIVLKILQLEGKNDFSMPEDCNGADTQKQLPSISQQGFFETGIIISKPTHLMQAKYIHCTLYEEGSKSNATASILRLSDL